MANNALLKIKELNRAFKTAGGVSWILKNVNLELPSQSFTIIYGPSGSGKSTLLNAILGLDWINSGEINFLGESLNSLTQDQLAFFRKRNIGIVYQLPNWVKSLNVLENVALPLKLQGISEDMCTKKALEVLTLVHMSDWARYNPAELSAGQQQRVALARALITDPRVIIADEPTGNLDSKSSFELMNLLKSLVSVSKSVIIVTHDRDSLPFADHIVQIIDGKIVQNVAVKGKDKNEIEELLDIAVTASNNNEGDQPIELTNSKHRSHHWAVSNIIFFPIFLYKLVLFIPLSILFIINELFKLFRINLLGRILEGFSKFIDFVDMQENVGRITYLSLLKISMSNLFLKKTRALVTIGGVALGMAFIVFLISIAYGIENLVIDRVAGLNEIKQTDVLPAAGSNLDITDETIAKIKDINNVNSVYPIISIAGKASIDSGVTDTVVSGVTPQQLEKSDVIPVSGDYFKQDKLDGYPIVVSTKLLSVFGLEEKMALGKSVSLTYVRPDNLLESDQTFENAQQNFSIVGVVEKSDTSIVYIPIDYLKATGIMEYSSLIVEANQKDDLTQIRLQLESLGFNTIAVTDTVDEIEDLFGLIRQIFIGIGFISLIVGALGMFNTLTVSLLERTREVGLMKAIGMQSREVYDLFMFEAMSIGILSGILGLILGVLSGYLLSLILTIFSAAQGLDPIVVVSVPWWLFVTIIVFSTLVGAVTGILPASRATKVSPIDALRYE